MTGCEITVVKSCGRRLAKQIGANGSIIAFDDPKHFSLCHCPIADLGDLHRLLERLQVRRDCAVTRGAIADPDRTKGVRRLLHPDHTTGDAETLRDVLRSWVAIDVDGLAAPEGIGLHDLQACGRAALLALPEAFHPASAIVQATASHTIKPGLRLRIWCWLARPLSCADLKRWLRAAPAVDSGALGAAQLIYTASPEFIGRADPLPSRLILLPGISAVMPPSPAELAPPPRTPTPVVTASAVRSGRYDCGALTSALHRISRAIGGRRNEILNSEAFSIFKRFPDLRTDEVCDAFSQAAMHAGLDQTDVRATVASARRKGTTNGR